MIEKMVSRYIFKTNNRTTVFKLFYYPRSYLEKIMFVSGNNASIQHPLIYKHPIRQDDTIMLALGSLSGRYIQINSDESKSELSKEKSQHIQGNYNQ